MGNLPDPRTKPPRAKRVRNDPPKPSAEERAAEIRALIDEARDVPTPLPAIRSVPDLVHTTADDPYAAVVQAAIAALGSPMTPVAAFPVHETAFKTARYGTGVLTVVSTREHVLSMIATTSYPGVTLYAVILRPDDLPTDMLPAHVNLLEEGLEASDARG